MSGKTKLELTWIGKDKRPRLEPRILLEDFHKSYFVNEKSGDEEIYENFLIFGDNLLALKALEHDHTGKIKCIFIDPPYNTGSIFAHYDDGLEHSIWLSLIRDRLEIFRKLLAENGSLWITIDDNEAHYLKILCDEIFGRENFVANVVWQKKYSKQNDARWLSVSHDHILIYSKNKNLFVPNAISRNEESLKGYSNPDDDSRGPWQSVVYTCAKSRAERPNLFYPITQPTTGKLILPNENRVWGYDIAKHKQHIEENRIWWGLNKEKDKPRLKVFLKEVGSGVVPDTLWLRTEAGDNQDSKREAMALNPTDTFDTPKPEKLLQLVITIATNPGDLVLDSFAGSGTTGAVAHKMGRRWIMVELGEHCHTHIIPRMKKVIDGQDPGGITAAVGWQGGGGFRYYRLAPSLLEKDKWGNWVVNREYNAAMLAEAMCKHENFTYAPSETVYWQQGHSTERDFIYTTTHALNREQLLDLSHDVGPDRSLLICCKAFRGRGDDLPNLTIKKIPTAVLARCEFGKDDYSLQVANLPAAPTPAADRDEPPPAPAAPGRKGRGSKAKTPPAGPTLFDADPGPLPDAEGDPPA